MSIVIDNEIEHDMTTCPQCEAIMDHDESYTGQLGAIEYHRCRYCGWQWAPDPGG